MILLAQQGYKSQRCSICSSKIRKSEVGKHFTDIDIATGQEAIEKTIDFAEKNNWGKSVTNYGLRLGIKSSEILGLPNSCSTL